MKRKLLLVVLLSLLSSWANAATNYFVTQAGAGSHNGLSIGNAFSVANYNVTTLPVGGDTVFFTGTITSIINPNSGGTSSSVVLTLDMTGAVITPPAWTNTNSQSFITILGSSSNPIAAGTNGAAIFDCGTNPAVQFITVSGFTFTGISGGQTLFFNVGRCNNVTIQNNTLDNVQSFVNAYQGTTHDITIQNNYARSSVNVLNQTDVISMGDTINVLIQGNKLIQQAPGNVSVRHNDTIQAYQGGGSSNQAPSGWVIRYNWVQLDVGSGSGDTSWTMLEQMADNGSTPALQMYGNVFVGEADDVNSNNGVMPGDNGSSGQHVYFYNNTLIRKNGPDNTIRFLSPGTVFSRNNVGYDPTGHSGTYLSWTMTAGAPWNNNFFFNFSGCSTTFTGGAGSCTADPKFTSVAGDDYSTLPGSPLRNAGDSTVGATYNQGIAPGATWPNPTLTTRTTGNWDVGAFQVPLGGMNSVYTQTQANDGNYVNNNNYPIHMLPSGRWRHYVQPIYEIDNIASWSNASNITTFTLGSGTTTMVANDVFTIRGTGAPDALCVVNANINTTSFNFDIRSCDSKQFYTNPGSGTFPAGTLTEKKEGPGMNPRGTWAIVNTGSITGKYSLQSFDLQRGSHSGCTLTDYDLHKSTCYDTAPQLVNEWNGGVYINVQDVGTLPACSQTGSIQTSNMVLSSTYSFDLTFTTTQTPSKSATQHFLVCRPGAGSGKGAIPWISPGYIQNYSNQEQLYIVENFASADKYGVWSITYDSPGSGNPTLETWAAPPLDGFIHNPGAMKPQAVVHTGTRQVGYTLQWCADSDLTACDSVRGWASTSAKPAGNVDGVKQYPCDVDPVMAAAGGQTYHIGPSQTYTSIHASPTQSYPWGSTFIVHNEGGVGSPTTYHEYDQWSAATNWASFTNNRAVPMFNLCTKPNTTSGELPVIDGDHAVGPSNVAGVFVGSMLIFYMSVSQPNPDIYNGNIQPAHRLTISGFKVQNANPSFVHYAPGDLSGTGPTSPYSDAAATRIYSAQQYSIVGNHTIDVANPFFSVGNANGGVLRNLDLDGWYEGNNCEKYSIATRSTEHCFYIQDWRSYVIGNHEQGGYGTDATGYFSFRATRSHYSYNFGKPTGTNNTGSLPGGSTEIQDGSNSFAMDQVYGPTVGWNGNCDGPSGRYPMCAPTGGGTVWFGGMDTVAALQEEHWDSFFVQSNALEVKTGNCTITYPGTHGDNGLELQHNLYDVNNNIVCPNLGTSQYEDFRLQSIGSADYSRQPIEWPAAYTANSMKWWNNNLPSCTASGSSQGVRPEAKVYYQTGIYHVGQFSPTTTGISQAYGDAGFESCYPGLNRHADIGDYTGMVPVEWKIGNWGTNTNFITTATQPYDSASLAPTSSAAVNAATPPLYPASMYPVLYNALNPNVSMLLTRRTQVDSSNFPTTIGSADAVGAPTLSSITVLPNPASVTVSGTVNMQTLSFCTYSDSSTIPAGSSGCLVVWTDTNTHSSINASTGVVTGVSAGSDTVTATLSPATPGTATVNVSAPPAAFGIIFGTGLTGGTGLVH